jgi:hypothetical protein
VLISDGPEPCIEDNPCGLTRKGDAATNAYDGAHDQVGAVRGQVMVAAGLVGAQGAELVGVTRSPMPAISRALAPPSCRYA